MALNTVQNGKGDKPRSNMSAVDDAKWERIFGKKKKTTIAKPKKPKTDAPSFNSIYKI